jgi:long-chain acyl-CoA synthetase
MNEINTIPRLFKNSIKANSKENCIGRIQGTRVKYITHQEYFSQVSSLSTSLLKLNIKLDSKVCILAETSYQWHIFDLAAICSNATTVPIYPTVTLSEFEYILNETEASLIFMDVTNQFDKFFELEKTPITLKYIVTLFKASHEQKEKCQKHGIELIDYQYLIDKGYLEKKLNPELFSIKSNNVKPDSLATIIYTSGTTGNPKGALITNQAFTQMLLNLKKSFSSTFNEQDVALVELPLSHVLGRCSSYLQLSFGLKTVFGGGIDNFTSDCSIAKPTLAIGVPRVFEKIYSQVDQKIKVGSIIEKRAFEWACSSSNSYYSKIDNDLSPTTYEIIQKNIAFKLIFQKLNKLFGGQLKYFICGGAALKPEISIFLRNLNLTILEGYGLTETIGPCVVNPSRKQLSGSVGLPIGDVKIKISNINEVLIKSKALCSGFLNNKSPFLDEQEWFHTGDIGFITSEGYLKITDRLKDMIVTSNGKTISPQKIEALMSSQIYIDQFIVIGEGRHYLTGIVSLNINELSDLLLRCKLKKTDSLEILAKNKELNQIIAKEIEIANQFLPEHEQVKNFKISTQGISIESGHVTPSLKIKRKKVLLDFEHEINAMYNNT